MIRDATEGDARALAEIYNYYIENTVVTFEQELVSESGFRERINRVQSAGFSWLVAEENEIVIGYAYSFKWNDRAAYRKTAEVSVYLSDGVKSKGWGGSLYKALFLTLQRQAIHVAIAGITLPNQPSVALHEKFGMEKVAHFKEVGYKFGKWLDVGYWQVKI